MPETVATSPGAHVRHRSPRRCTVAVQGMCPTGTSSARSCSRTCWYLTNLDPRDCMWSVPPELLHCSLGHRSSGRKCDVVTSWKISHPHLSHEYLATATSGVMSVLR